MDSLQSQNRDHPKRIENAKGVPLVLNTPFRVIDAEKSLTEGPFYRYEFEFPDPAGARLFQPDLAFCMGLGAPGEPPLLAEVDRDPTYPGDTAIIESDHIAQRLYEIYCAAVGGKAHDGNPLPSWEEFTNDRSKARQVYGWRAIATVVDRGGY